MLAEDADGVVEVEFVAGGGGWERARADGRVEFVGWLPGHWRAVRHEEAVGRVHVELPVGVQRELEALGVDDGVVVAGAEQDEVGVTPAFRTPDLWRRWSPERSPYAGTQEPGVPSASRGARTSA